MRALGRKGERALGLETIPLASIVGTIDRSRDFDRRFRPTSNRLRERWQGIDMALRRGRGMPPISVYRIGDLSGPGGAAKGNPRYEVMGVTRYWRYSKEKMQELKELSGGED